MEFVKEWNDFDYSGCDQNAHPQRMDQKANACDWCGAAITAEDSEDGLCARCARIAQEQDEAERLEFSTYIGWDGQEHAQY